MSRRELIGNPGGAGARVMGAHGVARAPFQMRLGGAKCAKGWFGGEKETVPPPPAGGFYRLFATFNHLICDREVKSVLPRSTNIWSRFRGNKLRISALGTGQTDSSGGSATGNGCVCPNVRAAHPVAEGTRMNYNWGMRTLAGPTLLLLAATFSKTNAEDWYRWRGPDLNGISQESGWQTQWPATGPKLIWTASVGTGFSSFSVHEGRVFTMGNANNTDSVFCFDAGTGKLLWKHSYPCPLDPKYFEGGPGSTPATDDGHVYSFSRKGNLFCLNETNGTVVWSKNLAQDPGAEIPTWGFAGSPLVLGDLVIVNAGDGGTALDKNTGKAIWTSGKAGAGYATPVPLPSPEKAVAIFTGKTLRAVNDADGSTVWSYPWNTEYEVNAADPIVNGNRIFISSGYNRGASVIRVEGNRPRSVWENKNMRNHFNSCVLWKDCLYGVDESELRCLSFDTGEVKWKYPQFGKGSLMLADGKIIGLGEKGVLFIAEATPAGFKPISQATVLNGKCWSTPVLSDGHIYCRNATGKVVCLDVGKQMAVH